MLQNSKRFKQALSVIVVLVLVGSTLSVAPLSVDAQQQQQSIQETEPNDAPKGGTPVVAEQINGALDPAIADWDWYVVRAEEGETIEATVNFETIGNANPEIDILAPNGTQLDHAESSEETQLGVAAVAPQTGLYYIGIESFYYRDQTASPSTLPYTLTVSPVMNSTPPSYTGSPELADQPRPEQEPNDVQERATRIQGAPITATMSSDNDTDWFAIEAGAGERIEAVVVFEEFNDDSYMRMEMRAPNGSYIGPFESAQTDRRAGIATIAQQSGTYYLRFSPTRPPENVNYTLTMFSVGGRENTTAATTPTAPGTQTTTTPSATTRPATQTNATSFPPGYSASGITNPTRALENHFSTLFGYESFTYISQTPFLTGTGTRITKVSQIDIVNRTGFAIINSSIPGVEGHARKQYWINGTYYAVFDSFNDTVGYQGYPQSFEDYISDAAGRTPPDISVIPMLLNNARFGPAERVTTGDEVLYRYNSTELLNGTNLLPVAAENATVDDFSASIVVDENGVIRSASYTITYTRSDGAQVTTRSMAQVTGINNTTATAPPWLPEAKTSLSTTNNSTILGIEGSVERAAELGAITPTPTTGQTVDSTTTDTTSSGEATTPRTDSRTGDSNTSSGKAPGSGETTTSSSGPGFGSVIAVVALLAVTLLAARGRVE